MRACPHGSTIPDGGLVVDIQCDPCFEAYVEWMVEALVEGSCLSAGTGRPVEIRDLLKGLAA